MKVAVDSRSVPAAGTEQISAEDIQAKVTPHTSHSLCFSNVGFKQWTMNCSTVCSVHIIFSGLFLLTSSWIFLLSYTVFVVPHSRLTVWFIKSRSAVIKGVTLMIVLSLWQSQKKTKKWHALWNQGAVSFEVHFLVVNFFFHTLPRLNWFVFSIIY